MPKNYRITSLRSKGWPARSTAAARRPKVIVAQPEIIVPGRRPGIFGRRPGIIAACIAVVLIVAGGTVAAIGTLGHHGTTSQLKGVGTWTFTGVNRALAASGASWYYNWKPTPGTMSGSSKVSFVPMIWDGSDVTTATLDQVKHEGHVLLGFNEPDSSSQANMSVQQALDLWPQLMATGMELGSPAVAADAATPGSWLDQFMSGVKARGYRVNFITVHWYGTEFNSGAAVQQLQDYLQAVYNRYHLPIWVTEFAMANFSSKSVPYPSDAQQAAFLTAATKMLADLSYVQRYAWFALPTWPTTGSTGLFSAGAASTEVGRAFKAAPA